MPVNVLDTVNYLLIKLIEKFTAYFVVPSLVPPTPVQPSTSDQFRISTCK